MPDINKQILHLQGLATQLAEAHSQLKEEKLQLTHKVALLENTLREKNSELAMLENELKTARIAKGIAHGQEEAELAKAKISSLTREIDRCIALLNE